MTAEELLAAGTQMMREGDRKVGSSLQIGAALLLRQALEDGIDRFWIDRHLAPLAHCTMRAQLISLRYYLDPADLAGEVSYAWHRLSDTVHHDVYELAPAIGELQHLAGIVGRFLSSAAAARE